MRQRAALATVASLMFLSSASTAIAAVPTVNTFTVAATAVSPVPVTAFTATDSDGTVVGYMVTQTNTKPGAADSRWTSIPWTSFTTSSIGAVTLYAWAKDNANGVSSAKTAPTNIVGGHLHTMAQVTGLTTALAGKASTSHDHDAAYQKKNANLVIASSAAELLSAVGGITDASATNPYVVELLPGVYDIGTQVIDLPAAVNLVGAGENVTIVRGSGEAVIRAGSGNVEIRSLTVEALAGTGIHIAHLGGALPYKIINVAVKADVQGGGVLVINATVSMENVVVDVAGNGTGLHLDPVEALLHNVRVTVRGDNCMAVYVTPFCGGKTHLNQVRVETFTQASTALAIYGKVEMSDCDVQAGSGVGVYTLNAGATTIMNSRISGGWSVISGPPATTKISFSQVDTTISGASCFQVHDENLNPVTCP